MIGSVRDFLESRGGISTLLRKLGGEPVPRRYGWLFTLGSGTLFMFCLQLVTGGFLAMYYAPTPDHAHRSVSRIQSQLPAGNWIRGLHFWGASAMVVLIFLHMMRVFWMGAYKKPRELNWIVGVALLLLVLAFAFTGYLLPWDQKAYWATVVGTRIAASAPVVGRLAGELLSGGTRVGTYTLSRFYALHVIWLPLAALFALTAHLLLLKRHGHAGSETDTSPRVPFFPTQMAKDAVLALVVFAVLLSLAYFFPPGLERVADPADASYVPRPDWYFLFLFELLKLFKGRWEQIGTIGLPGLAVLVLALLPWLDRKPERRAGRRPFVIAVGALAALAVVALNAKGILEKPDNKTASAPEVPPPPPPSGLAGNLVYTRGGCSSCHGPDGSGFGGYGLIPAPLTKGPDWITEHVREKAPALALDQVPKGSTGYAVAGYLLPGPDNPVDLSVYPKSVSAGGLLIWRENCRECHLIYREGGTKGPPLQHLAGRHDRNWLVAHFKDPRAFVPSSKMPSFGDLPDSELNRMADYLLALP